MSETTTTGTPLRLRTPRRVMLPGRLRHVFRSGRTARAGPEAANGHGVAFPLAQAAGTGGGVTSGTRLCPHVDLYHDGDAAAVACACPAQDVLALSCGAFGGSYLSLVAAVPEGLAARFGPGRVLRLVVEATTSRPITAFLRLNIGSADGQEVFYETLVVARGERVAEFDLDGVRLPFDARLRAWADLIFARPADAEITISQLGLRLIGKHEL